jgi:serine/threonine protein kinase
MSDAPGSLNAALAGRYRLERELGAGGMATVYLAHDLKHDRPVALKVLRPELAASLGAERFLAEIRLTAKLQHPHIVPLFDSGEAGGFLYYVMPFIGGESLRDRLEREKRLDVEAMLAIARPVAQALAYAHEAGVVHRDIKPENILLSRGQPFVTDFGIARAVTVAAGERLTATGVAVGTPAYMSPEQAVGEEGLDARSDVYSLGCVIYEMLSGCPPFSGGTVQALIARRLAGPPPHLTTVPQAVDEVVRRSLATAPQDRFATAVALADALVEAAKRPAAPELSLVVLPFENLSPDPDNAFFADGLTEELIADLSKVRALRVISRTSAMLLKGSKKDVPTIARELNVRYVLEGSVRRAANSLRITAQLIDAAADAHVWAEKYTGALDDVFDLQEKLSRQIVEALRLALTPEESRRLAARPIPDVRAYDAWLRARNEIWTLTPAGFDRAFRLVNRALEIVGENALLRAGLGFFYSLAYDFGISHEPETLEQAEYHAARALELDPELGLAHLAMGWVRYKHGEFSVAQRFFRRAVERERSTDALLVLSFGLGEVGRVADARRFADEAVAADPLNLMSGFARGAVEFFDGRFEEAAAWFRKYLETVAPGAPLLLWWLAQALAYAGEDAEPRELFKQVARMEAGMFSDLSMLYGLAAGGDREALQKALDTNSGLLETAKTDEWYPNFIAACLAMVGDHERAIDWLERAVAWGFCNVRFLAELSPFLAPLRHHPRFEALLEPAREKELAFEA